MKKNKKHQAQAQNIQNSKSGFKFSWLVWGAAAYYGLKYMNKRGILPAQTGKAMDFINKGIDVAKQRAGIGSTASTNTTSASLNY